MAAQCDASQCDNPACLGASAALAAGRAHAREHSGNGWTVRATKAPILSVAKRSLSEASHVAWKRELGLGQFAGQELPEALYGSSALELRHDASGVRLSFCALEALRAWAALGEAPIPHRSRSQPPAEWDWTFTSPYRGATAVAALGEDCPAAPDGASFYGGGGGAGEDAARGPAALRRPTCKCVFGRAPLFSNPAAPAGAVLDAPSPPPPPPWENAEGEIVDIESLLAAERGAPVFEETVDLWRDDLDPHSFAFFRVRVRVHGTFWVAFSRFFVRVNGARPPGVPQCFLLFLKMVRDGASP